MSIPHNPAITRLANDIKFYRRKISTPPVNDPTAPAEIRNHLQGKSQGFKVAAPNNDDILTGPAYRVFASWPSPTAKPTPNRLGGRLDGQPPGHLAPNTAGNPDGLPNPTAPSINWPPNQKNFTKVTINPDGAIVHIDPVTKLEIPGVHDYMHAIFDRILYDIRDLLESINDALEKYADQVSVTNVAAAESAVYTAAVVAFETYEAGLQPGGSSPFANAFNFVGVSPVVTNEGFIVSCRVKLNWKNPYHSSSTIGIP